jgi:hypothetical protein
VVLLEQEAFMRYINEILQNFGCDSLIEASSDLYKAMPFKFGLGFMT